MEPIRGTGRSDAPPRTRMTHVPQDVAGVDHAADRTRPHRRGVLRALGGLAALSSVSPGSPPVGLQQGRRNRCAIVHCGDDYSIIQEHAAGVCGPWCDLRARRAVRQLRQPLRPGWHRASLHAVAELRNCAVFLSDTSWRRGPPSGGGQTRGRGRDDSQCGGHRERRARERREVARSGRRTTTDKSSRHNHRTCLAGGLVMGRCRRPLRQDGDSRQRIHRDRLDSP